MKILYRRIERRNIKQLVKPWRLEWDKWYAWDIGVDLDEMWDSIYLSAQVRYDFIVLEYLKSTPSETLLPLRDEITNYYDVCDWRSYCPKDPRAYRK